ncbi:MAG: S-methyl-5'-thioadenosine phosphorylase [Candidatus Baldrarchaeia archaeon]
MVSRAIQTKSVKIAIIGGSGIYELFEHPRHLILDTPFGKTPRLEIGDISGIPVAFLPRHAKPGSEKVGHDVPPHLINYRANIFGLYSLGVERIIATSACGSLNEDIRPGDIVIITNFIDMTKKRSYTFFDGRPLKLRNGKIVSGVVHVDMTEPYCPELRQIIIDVCKNLGIKIHDNACYVCTEGPRFETAAEIHAYKILGADVVGMTNVPEVVLARELGMCYAAIGVVTNMAAGLQSRVSQEEVLQIFNEKLEVLRNILVEVIKRIPPERKCNCASTIPQE